ncbi:MAG: PhzF family phenazine biosynthesis protein [Pseudomonadota bacterium]
MTSYAFHTVDVFTERRFGGNPLAVFPDADGLDTATMQAIAQEMNYSETSFVVASELPEAHAKVRIFNRQHEMPFAGHPNVGTAYILARLGLIGDVVTFQEMAGLVPVRLLRDNGLVTGARIDAPQPLQVIGVLDPAEVADCIQIPATAVRTTLHPPTRATVGVDFVLVEIDAQALAAATPDISAYRAVAGRHPELDGRLSIFAYALDGDVIRARMFAPLAGTWEDPATGSANAALAALRLSLGSSNDLAYTALQGVEMNRPSVLSLEAWRSGGACHASVGGPCVPVFSGTIDI